MAGSRAETSAKDRPALSGSINLRIAPQTRQLIDEAASLLGKTRTDFMVDSARREAVDVLVDRRLFMLEAADFNRFVDALNSAPKPGRRLQSLSKRTPVWRKGQ